MKQKHLRFGSGFRVVVTEKHSQAAQMTLAPGKSEGGTDNRHQGADQWLFVVRGLGIAVVDGVRVKLRAGTLVLIAHGEPHTITNTGKTPLKTLNIYVPPAHRKDGDELPAAKQ